MANAEPAGEGAAPVGLRSLHRVIAALTPESFEIEAETPDQNVVIPLGEAGAARIFRVPSGCKSGAWLRGVLRENGWELRDEVDSAVRLSDAYGEPTPDSAEAGDEDGARRMYESCGPVSAWNNPWDKMQPAHRAAYVRAYRFAFNAGVAHGERKEAVELAEARAKIARLESDAATRE